MTKSSNILENENELLTSGAIEAGQDEYRSFGVIKAFSFDEYRS